MKKNAVTLCCIILSMAVFVSCAPTEPVIHKDGSFDYISLANSVDDSSDLPSWEGKQFNLRMWFASGTGNAYITKRAANDVVTPEIKRVTGVEYDKETSFDNGGESMDAKLGKIAVAKDWPDIIIHPENSILDKLIEADKIYDLTELIPKYCPNMMEMFKKPGLEDGFKSKRKDGKIYTINYNVMTSGLDVTNPELDPKVASRVDPPVDSLGFIMVRDDILKTIYPNALTQSDIEEIYMREGEFTREQIMDCAFNSKEEFFDFLTRVKELDLKEGNKSVSPFYTHNGSDNWALLTYLGFLYGYNTNMTADANYFTYWDKTTNRVEYMWKQDFFKQALRDYTRLIQLGIASKEALVDKKADFTQKLNFGLYATTYGGNNVDEKVLRESGKTYKYRKVYINIKPDAEKFLFTKSSPFGLNAAIVKGNITPEDLPQVLAYFDFAFTEAGKKLAQWGPRSAELWEDVDGRRVFIDKELEECLVENVPNDKDIYYGIGGKAWPAYPIVPANEFQPKLVYDEVRNPDLANKYFSIGLLEPAQLMNSVAPNIWEFDRYGVEGVQNFWQGRKSFEDAITKIFISKDDEEFERYYNEMLQLAERSGMDDKTLEEINTVYREKVNKDFMDQLN